MPGRLSREERERFLAEPHVATLSVEAGDRGPLGVPVWYLYEPGGTVRVLMSPRSRKAGLIRAAGRFSLLVQRMEPTPRYVGVEGPVTHSATADPEHFRDLASRYLPPELVDACVRMSYAHDPGPRVVFHLTPRRWVGADLGGIPDLGRRRGQ
ncbi:pyridoxamine 5'-phosphate oxidase family protein [Embleya sp. NPDC059259]|uniref:pyridoxamine 5'-phosphate oxidase family protein n=1 Tax=unclassified Embleya TaxID=2699296 RepID=UPI00369BD4EA